MIRLIRATLWAIAAITLSVAAIAPASEPPISGYSTDTLREPIFDEAQLLIETMAINNWLNANYASLSYEQMKGPREHLYYLIDSYIKILYQKEGKASPDDPDLILDTLFSWAERLGVYGGDLVHETVRVQPSSNDRPAMTVPEHFSLTLNENLFEVSSDEQGWSFTIPYYFMIWNMSEYVPTGGVRTQLVAFSTGTARDSSSTGHSQATVMFLYVPQANSEEVIRYWKQAMGMKITEQPSPIGVRDLESAHSFDNQSKLHKEIVGWDGPDGVFIVIYIGIEGTYQWNRLHFLDFLRAVALKAPINQQ